MRKTFRSATCSYSVTQVHAILNTHPKFRLFYFFTSFDVAPVEITFLSFVAVSACTLRPVHNDPTRPGYDRTHASTKRPDSMSWRQSDHCLTNRL
jgi:hypothetical protein